MKNPQFILASQSPRRAELLQRLGYRFDIQAANIDETRAEEEPAEVFVRRLAQEKAAAIDGQGLPVLGADTIVTLDEHVLGKPVDRHDALAMLALLSGSRHAVLTAVCVQNGLRQETIMSRTWVSFDQISPTMASAYWASGESEGKAGAYAVQGLAESFVREISGSYSGVVGLPLQQTRSLLKLFSIDPPALSLHE